MIYLDSLVEIANDEIIKGITALDYSIHGIVATTERGQEFSIYDINSEQISFDTQDDLFIYHRLLSNDFTVLNAPGKKYKYSIDAKMELICYAKNRDAQDYIVDRLSNVKDLEMTGSDNDSFKIFKEETGRQGGEVAAYVFKIFYTLKYKSDKCNVILSKV